MIFVCRAFELTKPRIVDPFYSELVQIFSLRARFWRIAGLICLALTILFVAACIWLFQHGDPQAKVQAQSESQLIAERTNLRSKLRETGTREAQELAQVMFIEKANMLANHLGQLAAAIDGLKSQKDKVQAEKLKPFLSLTTTVIKSLDSITKNNSGHEPTDFIFDLSKWGEDNASRIPTPALTIVGEQMRLAAIDPDDLKAEVAKVKATLDSLESSAYAVDSEPSKELDKIVTQVPAIRKLSSVSAAIKNQRSQAAQNFARLQENAPARERERQAIQQNMDQVEADLKEVRDQREKILFMAWVPDLTVRVGAVILMLFLTQIFVATYRYTIGLSAFYLARADAVTMLQPIPEKPDTYAIEHFAALADKMSPALSIDDIKGPTEQIGDLVKAWIAKVK